MMKFRLSRRFAAWLLLSVMIPTMVVVSLHHHNTDGFRTEQVCRACLNHVRHDGHLGTTGNAVHDCPLCQLHTLTFTVPVVTTLVVALRHGETAYAEKVKKPVMRVCGTKQSRAPPYILSL